MTAIDAVSGTVLAVCLAALSRIDLRTRRLPDWGTMPLLGLGLVWSYIHGANLGTALMGSAAGFLLFESVRAVYRVSRGREGLGGGDSELLAAGGAWCGWQGLAPIILVASFLALAFALPSFLKTRDTTASVAFGPFLAAGILTVWFTGLLWPQLIPGR